MTGIIMEQIIEEFRGFIDDKAFPCIGAKAALELNQIRCMVADHMACPKDDRAILNFLYNFIDGLNRGENLYHSAAVLFREPRFPDEESFDCCLWQRLQSFADIDAENYAYDARVSSDVSSPHFSFSLKEEAFYIIGMHPASSRASRRFTHPVLVFNSHAQFERLRQSDKFDHFKTSVRKRDIAFSGSVNPMLEDFGKAPEIFQYSGRVYDADWKCPLQIRHKNVGISKGL
jgi:hypothetical protein